MTGPELRRLRRERELTQANVATRLGVRRERITYLEGLARVPTRAGAAVVAAILEAATPHPAESDGAGVGWAVAGEAMAAVATLLTKDSGP